VVIIYWRKWMEW